MKYLSLLCLLLAMAGTNAQQRYTFQQYKAAYTPLDDSKSISVNGDSVWSDDTTFVVPIGFNFAFMDSSYTVMRLLLANLLFENTFRSFSPLAGIVIEDRGLNTGKTISPISYELVGITPDRILKIQWKNAGFAYDTASYANFQTWLYEGSNNIEARYGKCSVAGRLFQTQTGGPQVGVLTQGISGADSFICLLSNNPDSAKVKALNDNAPYSLDTMPREGTVYLFKYQKRTSIEPSAKAAENIHIFPNPARDYITLQVTSATDVRLENMLGQVLYYYSKAEGRHEIDVSGLPRGIYFLKAGYADKQATRKIILQ